MVDNHDVPGSGALLTGISMGWERERGEQHGTHKTCFPLSLSLRFQVAF